MNSGFDIDSSSSEEDYNSDEYKQLNDDFSEPGSTKPVVNVLVTGFGPFGEHSVNASWEAVKALEKLAPINGVKIISKEIPVVYQSVQTLLPELWDECHPDLVVHVGVAGCTSDISIETCAHKEGYDRLDITGSYPPSSCYAKDGPDCIHSGLDVAQLCKDVNESGCLAMTMPSNDAGRYLCEFIYYASLCQDKAKALFVHVPPLSNPYTATELGEALQAIIRSSLKQLDLYKPLPTA